MLDIKRIRQNPQELHDALVKRGMDVSIDELLKQDELRRKLLLQAEDKKAQRNAAGKKIGAAKKKGANEAEIAALMEEMRLAGDEIASLDEQIASLDAEMEKFLLTLPNYPHESVPSDSEGNTEVRQRGTPRRFLWEPKTYQDIGKDLGIAEWNEELEIYQGMGARLKRAIISLFLNMHCDDGYEEIETEQKPVLNLYADSILDSTMLPVRHCTASASLLVIASPDQSCEELEAMTASGEKFLQQLALPCRVAVLCAGRLAFGAAKTYSLEVWMPSLNRYVEAGSCSSEEAFYSRRWGIRFRTTPKEKPQHAHTLCLNMNTALIMAAVLENHQNEDGSAAVPEVLVPYMGIDTIQRKA